MRCWCAVGALLGEALGARWQPAPLARDYWLHVDHVARQGAPQPHAALSAERRGGSVHYPRGSEDITLRLDEGEGQPGARAVVAGHCAQAWSGNAVALGSAAAIWYGYLAVL